MKTTIKNGDLVVTIRHGDETGYGTYEGKTLVIRKTLAGHELRKLGQDGPEAERVVGMRGNAGGRSGVRHG